MDIFYFHDKTYRRKYTTQELSTAEQLIKEMTVTKERHLFACFFSSSWRTQRSKMPGFTETFRKAMAAFTSTDMLEPVIRQHSNQREQQRGKISLGSPQISLTQCYLSSMLLRFLISGIALCFSLETKAVT